MPNDTDKGEIDKSLENGPVEKRECRDILCCLLFCLAMAAAFYVLILGFTTGQPSKLIELYDQDVVACDADYPYLYFSCLDNANVNKTDYRICVKSCPTTMNVLPGDTIVGCRNTSATACMIDYTKVIIQYPSAPFMNKICIPTGSSSSNTTMTSGGSSQSISMSAFPSVNGAFGQLQQQFQNLYLTKNMIGAFILVSIVITFCYLVFLRYCSGVITWAIIIFYHLCLAGIAVTFYNQSMGTTDVASSYTNSMTDQDKLYVAYTFAGLFVVSVLCTLCFYSRIKLAIAIVKTASSYIGDVKSTLFIPIFTLVLTIIDVAFYGFGFMYIYAQIPSSPTVNKYGILQLTPDQMTQYYLWYWTFSHLWIIAFINALTQFVLASSASIWYFSQDDCHAPVTRSFYRAFRYHLGSLAFGSLLVALVQMARLVVEYIKRQMKASGSSNKAMEMLLDCLTCYTACLERIISWINKNAYIQIAINGKSFCGACKDALLLIIRNALRFAAMGGLGTIFINIGILWTCSGSLILAYYNLTNFNILVDGTVSDVYLPVAFVLMFAYCIASIFMMVYSISLDTILHCFITDEEIQNSNGGSNAKNTPAPLREFLAHNNDVKVEEK